MAVQRTALRRAAVGTHLALMSVGVGAWAVQ